MKLFLSYLKKYRWKAIFAAFLRLIEAVIELLNPLLVAKIVDVGVTTGDLNCILKIGLILLVINVLVFGISAISHKLISLTCSGAVKEIRKGVFKHVSTFSHNELDKFGTASLVNRITDDIDQVEDAISLAMRLIIRVPALLIGAFVLSLTIDKKMALLFLVLIPIVILILAVFMKKSMPYFGMVRKKLDKISQVTKENLDGTRVIRAFNKQDREFERFDEVGTDYTNTCLKISKIAALLNPVIFLVVDATTIAILAIGGYQIQIGTLTQGNVIALIDYVSTITISLLVISQGIILFVRTVASWHRIQEVLQTEPAVKNEPNAKAYKKLDYDALMEFDDVSFNYNLDTQTQSFIKDLSFKIYPNQTIGIIGGTGSGKTTIANLMLRFYDPTGGEILFKGKNLKDFTIEQLRKDISIVQQRSTLFSGSLRDNMKIRDSKATDEEIIEALKVAQAWSFVSEWRNGLDYQIMAGGKNVSGGQMQRLTIARALIGKPEMLILDDSSSALDFLTDSKLRKAIKQLNTTTVLISQRATSIKGCDLIIVLDNGDVVGMGKHSELMKNCNIYREIYESQSK